MKLDPLFSLLTCPHIRLPIHLPIWSARLPAPTPDVHLLTCLFTCLPAYPIARPVARPLLVRPPACPPTHQMMG